MGINANLIMYKSDHIKMYKIVDIISVITGGFNMIIDTDTVISDLKIETLNIPTNENHLNDTESQLNEGGSQSGSLFELFEF